MQSAFDECVLLPQTVKQDNMLMWAGWKYICLLQSDSVSQGTRAKCDSRLELTPL